MLANSLPQQHNTTPETASVVGAMLHVIELLFDHKEDVMAQLRLDTATWGLVWWEEKYGLPTDLSKPYDHRRSRIRAKLRGTGTTTVAMLQNMAESFTNGAVEVIEQKRQYRIIIKFVSRYGVPPNLDDLSQSIREVIPAHVDFEYGYTYYPWSVLDKQSKNFEGLDGLGLDWDAFERGEWLNDKSNTL